MQLCGGHERRDGGKGESTDGKGGPRVVEKEETVTRGDREESREEGRRERRRERSRKVKE